MSWQLNLNRGYLSALWGPNKNYLSPFLETTLKYYDMGGSRSMQGHVNSQPGQCKVNQVWRIYRVRTTGFLAGIRLSIRQKLKARQKEEGVGEEKIKLYGLATQRGLFCTWITFFLVRFRAFSSPVPAIFIPELLDSVTKRGSGNRREVSLFVQSLFAVIKGSAGVARGALLSVSLGALAKHQRSGL